MTQTRTRFSKDVARAQALQFVNRRLKHLGYSPRPKLPPGIRGSKLECPLARAFPFFARARSHSIRLEPPNRTGVTVTYPPSVVDFVYRLDNGEYPELTIPTPS